jgi:hypothetical protein
MDIGALPPEIRSGRMYSGPGYGSMPAAAAAWDGLAADGGPPLMPLDPPSSDAFALTRVNWRGG